MLDLTALYLAQAQAIEVRPAELFDIYLGSQNADGSWTPDADTYYYGTDIKKISFYNLVGDAKDYLPCRIKREVFSTSTKLEIETVKQKFDNVERVWTDFLASTDLRGKRVVVRRIFMDLLTDKTHAKILFDGIINKVENITEESVTIEVKSNMRSLDVRTGVLQQLYCPYKFGGTRCGIDREHADNKKTGTVDSGTVNSIVDTERTEASEYWNSGLIEFTSGDNDGEIRGIYDFDGDSDTLTLDFDLPNTPSGGDTYTIYRGCDKSFTMCGNKYSNKANFGGFPHIPQEINPQAVLE